jgi:hypothetical protein
MLSHNSRMMRTTNTRFENFKLGRAALGTLVSNALFFWLQFKSGFSIGRLRAATFGRPFRGFTPCGLSSLVSQIS